MFPQPFRRYTVLHIDYRSARARSGAVAVGPSGDARVAGARRPGVRVVMMVMVTMVTTSRCDFLVVVVRRLGLGSCAETHDCEEFEVVKGCSEMNSGIGCR